jgi:protein gp37
MMVLEGRKRNIEWSQKSWNLFHGCNGVNGQRCPGCYAHSMAKRLRGRYGYPEDDPFRPVFQEDKLDVPLRRKKPTVWFFCSMGEWLDKDIKSEWREQAIDVMEEAVDHIFITLTKQYANLWMVAYDSPEGVIPSNVWVGISVTKRNQIWGIDELKKVDAPIRLISFEPYLEDLSSIIDLRGIDWIIIGARTARGGVPAFRPKKEWVTRLVEKARETPRKDGALGIPVFLKPNLGDYVADGWFPERIEEMPRW